MRSSSTTATPEGETPSRPPLQAFLSKTGRLFDIFIDAMIYLAGIIVFIQAVWISEDVIVKKAFNFTWAPSFELLTFSLVWMTFLGTTAIYRDRGHVVMEAIVARFAPRVQDIMNLVTTVACAGVLLFLLFFTARLTFNDYVNHVTLPSVMIPRPVKWPVEIVIPFSFLLLFIQALRHMRTYYRAFKTGEVVKAGEQSSF